jgi:hypothetical protein
MVSEKVSEFVQDYTASHLRNKKVPETVRGLWKFDKEGKEGEWKQTNAERKRRN